MRAVVLVVRPRHGLELCGKYVHGHAGVGQHVAHFHVAGGGVAVDVEEAGEGAFAVLGVFFEVEFVVFGVEVDDVGSLVVEVLIDGFIGIEQVLQFHFLDVRVRNLVSDPEVPHGRRHSRVHIQRLEHRSAQHQTRTESKGQHCHSDHVHGPQVAVGEEVPLGRDVDEEPVPRGVPGSVQLVVLCSVGVSVLVSFIAIGLVLLPEVLVPGVVLLPACHVEVAVGVVLAPGKRSRRRSAQHF